MTTFLFLKNLSSKWKTIEMSVASDEKDSFGLKQATLEKLKSVFQKHDAIDSVIIYGSRAKGTYKEGSDIDLTIKGLVFPFAELMQIEDQIDDLYLPYGVDLSQYEQLKNPDLISHIDRLGVVMYMKNQAGLYLRKGVRQL
jgi:predicted nucleotidyltransferase